MWNKIIAGALIINFVFTAYVFQMARVHKEAFAIVGQSLNQVSQVLTESRIVNRAQDGTVQINQVITAQDVQRQYEQSPVPPPM